MSCNADVFRRCLKLDDIVMSDSCEPMPMWYFIDQACKTTVSKRTPEFDAGPLKCEMPLSISATCGDCKNLGPFMNCKRHMRTCHDDIFLGCENCSRLLCKKHIACFCRSSKPATLQRGKNTSPGQCTSRGCSNGTNPNPGS
jgi:hypothetical protein